LRRHALGICRLLIENDLSVDLKHLIKSANAKFAELNLKTKVDEELIYQFILDRLKGYLKDQMVDGITFSAPEIEAVLSQEPRQINDLLKRLHAIRQFNQLPEAAQLAAANKRISNILKKMDGKVGDVVKPNLLTISAEKDLFKALQDLEKTLDQQLQKQEFVGLLQSLVSLSKPIDQFFADVMVMDENQELRQNRLSLLNQLHQRMNLVADIGKLA
jgi:glycyl-tRNA synthetase beta chain